jgi:hypothetical protein
MFTDTDWDVHRRITAIALNDDVDEPDETRFIYFDTASECTKMDVEAIGTNHNPSTHIGANRVTCIADHLYNDAVIHTVGAADTDTIAVEIFDDDIADLVVLCGSRPGGKAAAIASGSDVLSSTGDAFYSDTCGEEEQEAGCNLLPGCFWTGDTCAMEWEDDEAFIGSYDASHASKRWDENTVRRGGYAEDGMSYSQFGGGLSTVGHRDPSWPQGCQRAVRKVRRRTGVVTRAKTGRPEICTLVSRSTVCGAGQSILARTAPFTRPLSMPMPHAPPTSSRRSSRSTSWLTSRPQ